VILVIDNYDSFTYNLVQYLGELEESTKVYRNDKITVDECIEMQPDAILVSPGPRTPTEAGISCELIERVAGSIPLLGVCLGHQGIGQVFGGDVVLAKRVMHGKSSPIHHDGRTIFEGLPNPFSAIRYHSLLVDRETLPDCLEISAETDQGEIMGLRHKDCVVEGVQFHPESIMTEAGMELLRNFLALAGRA